MLLSIGILLQSSGEIYLRVLGILSSSSLCLCRVCVALCLVCLQLGAATRNTHTTRPNGCGGGGGGDGSNKNERQREEHHRQASKRVSSSARLPESCHQSAAKATTSFRTKGLRELRLLLPGAFGAPPTSPSNENSPRASLCESQQQQQQQKGARSRRFAELHFLGNASSTQVAQGRKSHTQ